MVGGAEVCFQCRESCVCMCILNTVLRLGVRPLWYFCTYLFTKKNKFSCCLSFYTRHFHKLQFFLHTIESKSPSICPPSSQNDYIVFVVIYVFDCLSVCVCVCVASKYTQGPADYNFIKLLIILKILHLCYFLTDLAVGSFENQQVYLLR